jgi:hypothetical protein
MLRSIRPTRATTSLAASVDPTEARCAKLKGIVLCLGASLSSRAKNVGPPRWDGMVGGNCTRERRSASHFAACYLRRVWVRLVALWLQRRVTTRACRDLALPDAGGQTEDHRADARHTLTTSDEWGSILCRLIHAHYLCSINEYGVPGTLKLTRISVGGADSVWGINESSDIFQLNPSTQRFEQIPVTIAGGPFLSRIRPSGTTRRVACPGRASVLLSRSASYWVCAPPTGGAKGPPPRPKAKQPPGNAPTSTETRTVRTFHGQGAM